MTSAALTADLAALERSLASALRGRPEVTRLTAAVFLAQGHLLIEDVPGVGKTTLAKALASAVTGSAGRIQFTPDLLPTDLTGVSIYREQHHRFVFRPGPIFATVVIGDEINRASPKTQSALLEAMEERQVTVDGTTYPLPDPFMVIATQNPSEMAGTYPLPESQRDRFMARTSIGYPSADDELQVLTAGGWSGSRAEPVYSPEMTRAAMAQVREVFIAGAVAEYVLALLRGTRTHEHIALGASPRAGLHLLALAQAWAAIAGRDFVLPDDIQALLLPVIAHRLTLTRPAQLADRTAEEILLELRAQIPVP